jgi:glycosyltransferase 2 family protein
LNHWIFRKKRFWVAAALGLSILYITLNKADFKKLGESLQDLNTVWTLAALLASVVSYTFIAAVLHRLLRGMRHPLPFSASFRISLVSTALNYVMAIGGLSGMAVKILLLSREKVPASSTLSISMVHGFLTNTVAVLFVYLGFFFLYSEYKMSVREMEAGVFILIVAFLLTWVTIRVITSESFRMRTWRRLMVAFSWLGDKLHHPRWFQPARAERFFDNFNRSMNLLVEDSRILLAPAFFAILDWFFMFVCLKASFLAVHYPVDDRSLLVGFSVGIFAGIFSITPASIGIMEASMAGCFYLMGLDYDRALLATLIYRAVYYFLPLFVSFFFYKDFFVSSAEQLESENPSPSP